MRCSKARKLIPKYVDSELRDSLVAQLRGHIETCASCAAEEAEIRATLGTLDRWPSTDPKLGFDTLLSRIEQTRGKAPQRRVPAFGVPSWAAAALATVSIGAGVIVGIVTQPETPVEVPSEQQVASAIGMKSFDDVFAASLTYDVTEANDTEKGESL